MAKPQQELSISLEALESLAAEITAIDVQITAATGSDREMKKAISEKLATENSEKVNNIVDQLIASLESLEVPVLAGLTSRLSSTLNEKFSSKIDDYLNKEVANASAGTKEGVETLRTGRKTKLEMFRALNTVLTTFEFDTSSVPEPKKSAGKSASSSSTSSKTGWNKEEYRYYIDGNMKPWSQNSISASAFYASKGVPHALDPEQKDTDRWSTAQVKDFLVQNGVNFGADPTWEVKLPNGAVLAARKFNEEELAHFTALEAKETTENTPEQTL